MHELPHPFKNADLVSHSSTDNQCRDFYGPSVALINAIKQSLENTQVSDRQTKYSIFKRETIK